MVENCYEKGLCMDALILLESSNHGELQKYLSRITELDNDIWELVKDNGCIS